jgi:hypothetical protein
MNYVQPKPKKKHENFYSRAKIFISTPPVPIVENEYSCRILLKTEKFQHTAVYIRANGIYTKHQWRAYGFCWCALEFSWYQWVMEQWRKQQKKLKFLKIWKINTFSSLFLCGGEKIEGGSKWLGFTKVS